MAYSQKVVSVCLWTSLISSAHLDAIVFYDGDNERGTADPMTGLPFYAVARICNSTGGQTAGSAVYIRDGFLLTANHVDSRTHVTFDGSDIHPLDSAFTPIQIGSADLKLLRLAVDPEFAPVSLFNESNGDVGLSSFLVGWGRGRNPAVSDLLEGSANHWTWGDDSTLAKRWSTNVVEYGARINGLYDGLVTRLDLDAGSREAGLATYDSGAGLFIQQAGVWYLSGIATGARTLGSSNFNDTSIGSDRNYFVRVGPYAAAIEERIAAYLSTPSIETWRLERELEGGEAEILNDGDGDGLPLLLEYAFGGNPMVCDTSIVSPTTSVFMEGGQQYLRIRFTRPESITDLEYKALTSTDLVNWTDSSSAVSGPDITSNGDGTETVVYRRVNPIDGGSVGYLRIVVSYLN
ncbi:MAG: hypothetical protein ACPGKS_04130 [Coraliomargarita sp.]